MCGCQKAVIVMAKKGKNQNIIKPPANGILTAAMVTAAGLHRSVINKLLQKGEIYSFSRGLYVYSDAWEDDFYLLQKKYGRGIYSHDTALYLHGFSDRAPIQYKMTFPKGYNSLSLKKENISIVRVSKDNYFLGVTTIKSPCGNPIFVYDIERTLCDILRGSGSEIYIINEAMKKYVSSKDKDINKLLEYAQKLHVKNKILHYIEVLL